MALGTINTRAYSNLRRMVLERDRHECQIRGPRCTRWATTVDHIISRAEGGAVYDPRNMRAACRTCNGERAPDAQRAARYRRMVPEYISRM